MNTLSIEKRKYDYLDKNAVGRFQTQSEFIVDGLGLSTTFDFESDRPWFGEVFLDFTSNKDWLEVNLDQFLGRKLPTNQFGSSRFALYRCRCGCDYCGIISCDIERKGDSIFWRSISYEDDWEDYKESGKCEGIFIEEYEFNYEEYEACALSIIDSKDSPLLNEIETEMLPRYYLYGLELEILKAEQVRSWAKYSFENSDVFSQSEKIFYLLNSHLKANEIKEALTLIRSLHRVGDPTQIVVELFKQVSDSDLENIDYCRNLTISVACP